MSPTRILIADVPTMLRDILLDTVADEPDMEVVGVVGRGASIAGEVDRTGATIVIVGVGVGVGDGEAAALAEGVPLLRRGGGAPGVVAITRDGRDAFLQVALGEISPQRMVHTIRRLPTICLDD